MESSTYREAISCATPKQSSEALLSPIIHFRFHKDPPLSPSLNTTITSYLSWFNLNIYTHQRLGLSNHLFSTAYPKKILYAIHLTNICPTCPAHHFLLSSIILIAQLERNIWWRSH
jgi:hypothetical protein